MGESGWETIRNQNYVQVKGTPLKSYSKKIFSLKSLAESGGSAADSLIINHISYQEQRYPKQENHKELDYRILQLHTHNYQNLNMGRRMY